MMKSTFGNLLSANRRFVNKAAIRARFQKPIHSNTSFWLTLINRLR